MALRQGRQDQTTHFPVGGLNKIAASEQFNYGMQWNGGDKYNVLGRIGGGAYADVFKVATKKDGEVFAVKQLNKDQFVKKGSHRDKMRKEVSILESLQHVSHSASKIQGRTNNLA